MTVVPRKTFYERQPSGYEAFGGLLGFARAIAADSLLLNCALTGAEERAAHALQNGWTVWWWAGPDKWLPENRATWDARQRENGTPWRATRDRCVQLIANGMGIGYVANVERAPQWRGQSRDLDALAGVLDNDSRAGLSIGFSSFPSWPYWRVIAHRARLVWASPQLYGIVDPGTPAELLARGAPWAQEFGGGYVPSLAAWSRSAAEQAAYLDGMRSVPGAAFWHGLPAPSGPVVDVLRAWEPAPPFSQAPPPPAGPPGLAGC